MTPPLATRLALLRHDAEALSLHLRKSALSDDAPILERVDTLGLRISEAERDLARLLDDLATWERLEGDLHDLAEDLDGPFALGLVWTLARRRLIAARIRRGVARLRDVRRRLKGRLDHGSAP